MAVLETVHMAPWIMAAYNECISLMAQSEEPFPRRLADAVTDTLWQESVLEDIPPAAKDHMAEWLKAACHVDLFEGENLLKHESNHLHEMICKLDNEKAKQAIEHICEAAKKIADTVLHDGFKVKKNAQ